MPKGCYTWLVCRAFTLEEALLKAITPLFDHNVDTHRNLMVHQTYNLKDSLSHFTTGMNAIAYWGNILGQPRSQAQQQGNLEICANAMCQIS